MFIDEYREDVSPESLMARDRGLPLKSDEIKHPSALLALARGLSRDQARKIDSELSRETSEQ